MLRLILCRLACRHRKRSTTDNNHCFNQSICPQTVMTKKRGPSCFAISSSHNSSLAPKPRNGCGQITSSSRRGSGHMPMAPRHVGQRAFGCLNCRCTLHHPYGLLSYCGMPGNWRSCSLTDGDWTIGRRSSVASTMYARHGWKLGGTSRSDQRPRHL